MHSSKRPSSEVILPVSFSTNDVTEVNGLVLVLHPHLEVDSGKLSTEMLSSILSSSSSESMYNSLNSVDQILDRFSLCGEWLR